MKKSIFILFTIVLCLVFCGCRRVIENSADELTTRNWHTETLSGMTGELIFSGNEATLVITSSEDEVSLSGVYSIDSKNVYITDVNLSHTYVFSYNVYHNRADIAYGGDAITFYPELPSVTSMTE
ncbi:MAG: hypothetical protein E7563_00140 [Ruminococcaceae bacterium]|nr:hypothetical protein [Oscillospiraceae bacterium]